MIASSARQSLAALPDGVRTRLNGWRRSLAEIELAARMGSPDADRHRRQILAEVASALAQLPNPERAHALPAIARALRVNVKEIVSAIPQQPEVETPAPPALDAISDPLAALRESEARRRRRLAEIVGGGA